MRRVSVVIASRYPVVLHGLAAILSGDSDLSIVATCQDGESCKETVNDLAPDLVLIDVSLDAQSSLEVLAAIKFGHLSTRVILLSTSPDVSDLEEQITRGAHGVIPRDATPDSFVRILRQAVSTLKPLPPPKSSNGDGYAPQSFLETSSASLTDRERQIMHAVRQGLSNKDIGRRLGLSGGTVKVHLHHIFLRLAIHNRTALAALASPRLTELPGRRPNKYRAS